MATNINSVEIILPSLEKEDTTENVCMNINVSYIKYCGVIILVRLTNAHKDELRKFGIDLAGESITCFGDRVYLELHVLDNESTSNESNKGMNKVTAFKPNPNKSKAVFKFPIYDIKIGDKFRQTLNTAFAEWIGITLSGFDFPPDYTLIENEVTRIQSILRS